MTLRIAITGGMGAGKSLLAGWLRAAGLEVLDADEIGRVVVEENPVLLRELAAAFGAEILDAAGRLDRAGLGRRAFASAGARERLEALVFPYLDTRLSERLEAARGPVVFVDAALVFEWGRADRYDEIWTVTASPDKRLARAARRLGLAPAEAAARLARQLPQDEKVRRAHRVLDNEGPALRLWEQADRELQRLGLDGLPASTRPDNADLEQGEDPACPPPAVC